MTVDLAVGIVHGAVCPWNVRLTNITNDTNIKYLRIERWNRPAYASYRQLPTAVVLLPGTTGPWRGMTDSGRFNDVAWIRAVRYSFKQETATHGLPQRNSHIS